MRAVKFGARADSVSAVKSMDHEQHWLCPMVRSIISPYHYFVVTTVPYALTGITIQ